MKKNKKRKKNKKNQHFTSVTTNNLNQQNSVIDVSNKKNISIVDYNLENLDENEYKRLLNELEEVENYIRNTYYSTNISIEKTFQRSFFDLLKLFLSSRI